MVSRMKNYAISFAAYPPDFGVQLPSKFVGLLRQFATYYMVSRMT